MDYQLAGTEAPEVKVSHARGLEPTVWTLLWADHRYEDGSIPEEEALFFAIPETPPPAPADSGPTRCEGGRPCPREGYWFTPAKTGSRRHFQAGETMPDFNSDYGSTFWQWDERQET